jgi:hypothetical protein
MRTATDNICLGTVRERRPKTKIIEIGLREFIFKLKLFF